MFAGVLWEGLLQQEKVLTWIKYTYVNDPAEERSHDDVSAASPLLRKPENPTKTNPQN